MKTEKLQMKKFFSYILGGPNHYDGKSIQEAHPNVKVKEEQFDVLVELIITTLQELGIDSKTVDEIRNIITPLRS
jgi:hemoglobin